MLHVKFLGQFSIQLDDHPVEIPSRPAQALFAYLILNAGTAYRREKLAGLLWPDTDDVRARNNLRHLLWRIRKVVGATYLHADDLTIGFNADADYELDVAALEREIRSDTSTDSLIAEVSLYSGEFLPGFYEDWIALERERLQATFERKMEQLSERLIANQRWPETIEWAERWIALGQLPEAAYRALLVAHFYLGNTASIALVYQRCAAALQKELGVEPAEQTQSLYRQLSYGQALYGDAKTPIEPASLKPITAPHPARHNLPPQATTFIGRSTELAEIAQRLSGDLACRLLNIIGPGGIGKTRLALEAAQQHLADFADGVYFVPLAPVTADHLIAPAIAQALQPPVQWQIDPRVQVLEYLRDKQLLLVVDNLEHLPAGVDLLVEILTAAPRVKLLVTSRERLNLQWEWVLEIRGLEFPEAEQTLPVGEFSAVQLFMDTARRMDARFVVEDDRAQVIRICRLLEGSPLGIELAAAWVRVLPCAEIAQQIEHNLDLLATTSADRPERHRSLRAAFEYSWNLLSINERKAAKKLAVFQGSFRHEAAEKVAGAPLTLLFALVDKSLLRRSAAGRFEMHSLVRQYIIDKLNAGEIDEVLNTTPIDLTQIRLAQYYLAYARQHQLDVAALDAEWANLMAGMNAAQAHELWRIVLEYAATLQAAGFALGRFTDIRQSCAWATNAAQALDDQPALAACWLIWGQACLEQGDYDEAHDHLTRSFDQYRQLSDLSGTARAQLNLARIALDRADYAEASSLLANSQRICQLLPDDRQLAEIYSQQARIAFYQSVFTAAEQLAQQALDLQQKLSDKANGIFSLRLLAEIALYHQADATRAEQLCIQALAWCDELHDDGQRAIVQCTLAEVQRLVGKLDESRHTAEDCLRSFKRMGNRRSEAQALYQLSVLAADRGDMNAAIQNGTLSLALCRQIQDGRGLIEAAYHLGEVFARLQQTDRAYEVRTEALAMAESLQHPRLTALRQRLQL
jgi:predicted ATPase/DNA-binding SARP family transcriptional activator